MSTRLKPKLLSVMKTYNKEQFVKDVIAGLIVAIIALPLSIALAISSGVSPEQGLYTAIIAGFFISLLGGSRVQIGGPSATFMVVVYSVVAAHGTEGLLITTILAGIILILFGLLKLGSVIKYIPYPITVGFTSGIALRLLWSRNQMLVKNTRLGARGAFDARRRTGRDSIGGGLRRGLVVHCPRSVGHAPYRKALSGPRETSGAEARPGVGLVSNASIAPPIPTSSPASKSSHSTVCHDLRGQH